MIDKDRLLEWLEEKATETGSWVEQVLLRNLVSEEIKKGTFDPIPLPTIKPGDRVLHGIHGMGTVDVPIDMVYVQFDKYQHLMFRMASELEVIPNE